MKVLLLIDSLTSGGKERRLVELVKGLATYPEVQLHLVVFSTDIHYKEVFELGIPITILKRIPKRNPMVFYRLFVLCRQWRPSLIHSWGTMSTVWAIPSSLFLRIKLINANIADAPKNMKLFDQRLFRARLTFPFSKVVVGNSHAGLEAYKVPKRKRVCIYNGFDSNRILNLREKTHIRKQWNINAKNVIGMVAGFYDRKDYATFLRAGLELLGQRTDVAFMAVGSGPNLEKCKAMIPAEFGDHFVFTGVQTEVESIVNIFDIGVLATNEKEHGEGISNSILEYMALAKPTVATIGGGTNEVLDHMGSGILVPPANPGALADKLMYLLDRPEEMETMGAKARSRLNDVFALPKMTKAYYQLYNKVLAGKENIPL